MLIDINSYIGHWPFRKLVTTTCEEVIGRMNATGVDMAVISNINGIFYKDTQSANEELYHAIKASSVFTKRLLPMAVLNPIYNGWRQDFKTCIDEWKMKGIRLHPQYHGYTFDNEECITLAKMARDKGVPIAVSLRMVDSRPSSWLDISQEWTLKNVLPLIKAVPDAKYMILNMANANQFNVYDKETTELIRKTDMVFDTSGRMILNLGDMLKTYGEDKFAFGSHAPIFDSITGLLRIESLRESEANAAVKRKLYAENAQRILSIK